MHVEGAGVGTRGLKQVGLEGYMDPPAAEDEFMGRRRLSQADPEGYMDPPGMEGEEGLGRRLLQVGAWLGTWVKPRAKRS
jgi:hypothetical protein